MNQTELLSLWKQEEAVAHIHGWDFSHIDGRYEEEQDIPWSYRDAVMRYLTKDARVLDIDTGGGEFLLSLRHPTHLLAATEAYPPNAELCREKLIPLGVEFREASGKGPLPFPDARFDLVIDRHGDFCPEEIFRVLKIGGTFVTQQVGAENDRELVELLLPGETELPFPDQYLSVAREKFERAGFRIKEADECFRPIRFFDVGALVWFARIIEWEFPNFSVDRCQSALFRAQKQLEQTGVLEGRIHRFFLAAQKP